MYRTFSRKVIKKYLKKLRCFEKESKTVKRKKNKRKYSNQ